MVYRVGDRVMVRPDIREYSARNNTIAFGVVYEMIDEAGKIYTIMEKELSGGIIGYSLNTVNSFLWAEELLQPVIINKGKG